MSLFDSLGQKQTPQNLNFQEQLKNLKRNPVPVIKQAGFNVPDSVTDPAQIIQYLVQSGQISNPRVQIAQRMMDMMGRR